MPKKMKKSRRSKNLDDDEVDCVTVQAEINLIRRVAYCEIVIGTIILLSQTVAIAASHEFATRSITGIWTSWFFFISAAIALFWSSRCTFNGLLAVLVFQIISATMGIPLFTACCLLFGVYPFKWNLLENGEGAALVGSSTAILITNLIMLFSSILEMVLNGYNAYNCYFLAYGGKPKIDEPYDYEEYDENDDGFGVVTINQPNPQQHAHNNGKQKQNSNGTNQQKRNTNSGKSTTSASSQNQKGKSNQNQSKPNSSSKNQSQNKQTTNSNNDDDWGATPTNNTNSNKNQQATSNNDDDWGDNTTTNTNFNKKQQSTSNNDDDWGDNNTNYNNYNSTTNYQNYSSGGGNNDENWGTEDSWDGHGGGGTANNSNRQNQNSNGQKHTSGYNGSNKQSITNHNKNRNPGQKSSQSNPQALSPRRSKGDNFVIYDDPSMPQPPPDLTIAMSDIIIIKYCGATGVIFAFIIFSCQTAMLAIASEPGIKIGVGIWGALYYATTGVITVYNGWKPTAQSAVAIFILQAVQFILSIPLVGISYYIVAVFGSCIQFHPVPECPSMEGGLTVTILGSVMAISGTVQGLMALILLLICSQAVCGIRCMISGATVYPTL